MDPNFDIVPTLRMFDSLIMDKAADEIERLRKELKASDDANKGYRLELGEARRELLKQATSVFMHSGGLVPGNPPGAPLVQVEATSPPLRGVDESYMLVERMIRLAGLYTGRGESDEYSKAQLHRFAAMVAEECAKRCEDVAASAEIHMTPKQVALYCAGAARVRFKEPT